MKNRLENAPRTLWVILMLVFVVPFTCTLTTSVVLFGYFALTEASQTRAKALPLSDEVVDDLCVKFAVDPTDRRCQHDEKIYTPDFIEVISENLSSPDTTFELVDEKLGAYRTECSATFETSEKEEYFICEYDLTGDGIYSFSIFFYGNGTLMKIHFS